MSLSVRQQAIWYHKVFTPWLCRERNGTRCCLHTSLRHWLRPVVWNGAAEQAAQGPLRCLVSVDLFAPTESPARNFQGRAQSHYVGRPDGRPQWRPKTTADLCRRVFQLIDNTPWIDWILPTQYPEQVRTAWPAVDATRPTVVTRLLERLAAATRAPSQDHRVAAIQCLAAEREQRRWGYRHNVWLLVPVATQAELETRVPALLGLRDLAPILAVKASPREPLRFDHYVCQSRSVEEAGDGFNDWTGLYGNALNGYRSTSMMSGIQGPKLDWVVARAPAAGTPPEWLESLRTQCHQAETPFYFEGWGPRTVFLPTLGGQPHTALPCPELITT